MPSEIGKHTHFSFYNATIAVARDSKAFALFTMKLRMNEKNTFALRSPLVENPKHNLNGILPPFEIEGRDGGIWDEMMW